MTKGRFSGLTDTQWQVIEPLLPKEPEKRGKGSPHAPWRPICNTILWILITGSRWCDIPKGAQWGSRTGSHRWLGRWQTNGTLDRIQTTLIETAELAGKLNWERLAANVFFPRGKGGGEEIEYGFKGKGTTTHLLVDGNGSPVVFTSTPANGDECKQVEPLLDRVHKHIVDLSNTGIIPILEADKGYDAESLRDKLLRRRIFPGICRRKKPGKEAEKLKLF
ncbi:IS5 family transposase [Parachlamydia acanthamoebae]|uniref:Uncharacterized protein n=1 Tax=Parachlamydia acanthamoebae TaxID=83552 RepID=A0A0C1EPE9_9BACT|nr:IS5 family transposase [Parachlamydia acanthamoebae]KIA78119.1 hypothetical protein DB43_EU00030 [Parachlamydia acanthamoebae]